MNDVTSHVPPDPHRLAAGAEPSEGELLRSRELLQVGTEVLITGRAVLRKYVITETVTQTFEVRREEVRLDYEPAPEGAATGETFVDDRCIEIVLHREVPQVQLRVEPTERIRIHVDTVITEVPISAELREERIDLDQVSGAAPGPGRPPH